MFVEDGIKCLQKSQRGNDGSSSSSNMAKPSEKDQTRAERERAKEEKVKDLEQQKHLNYLFTTG